jgi:hypothetical protein
MIPPGVELRSFEETSESRYTRGPSYKGRYTSQPSALIQPTTGIGAGAMGECVGCNGGLGLDAYTSIGLAGALVGGIAAYAIAGRFTKSKSIKLLSGVAGAAIVGPFAKMGIQQVL